MNRYYGFMNPNASIQVVNESRARQLTDDLRSLPGFHEIVDGIDRHRLREIPDIKSLFTYFDRYYEVMIRYLDCGKQWSLCYTGSNYLFVKELFDDRPNLNDHSPEMQEKIRLAMALPEFVPW